MNVKLKYNIIWFYWLGNTDQWMKCKLNTYIYTSILICMVVNELNLACIFTKTIYILFITGVFNAMTNYTSTLNHKLHCVEMVTVWRCSRKGWAWYPDLVCEFDYENAYKWNMIVWRRKPPPMQNTNSDSWKHQVIFCAWFSV